MLRRGVVLSCVAVLGVSLPALADTPPSPWDRAKDSRVGDDWDLHVRVNGFLAYDPREMELERHRKRQAVASWLEEAHAESSPDVRLRFDLGEVYVGLKHYARAVDVLVPALASAPDHPAATSAWIDLADAYAHLDRSREEVTAYDAYLARTLEVGGRATAIGNRAEAQMRLGHLEEAVLGYRDAIALSESVSGVQSLFIADVLAHWGLAVALDRSGDETGGAKEALAASQFDSDLKIISNTEFVFFVPDYERFYYLGLAATVYAKQGALPYSGLVRPPTPRVPRVRRDPLSNGAPVGSVSVAELWEKVALDWTSYIAGAEAWNRTHKDRPDRWLPLAKAHLAKAQKERAAAEARNR